MGQEIEVVKKKTSALSVRRKAELFDEFLLVLTAFIPIDEAVQCLKGYNNSLGNSDYAAVLDPFFDLMTGEEMDEVLKRMLPILIEQDLGAKKVSIKW